MRNDMRVERRVRKGTKSSSLGSSTIASESSSETGTAKQQRDSPLGTKTKLCRERHAGAFRGHLSAVRLNALYLPKQNDKETLKRYSAGIGDELEAP